MGPLRDLSLEPSERKMVKFDFGNVNLSMDSINLENLGIKTVFKTVDIKMIDDNKENDKIYT
jgi:hypothetical protein